MKKDKTVKELIYEGKLPYTTPCECECGADLLVNPSLTRLYCSNNACIVHSSQKFKDMLDILNIKVGIGDQLSEEVVDYLDITKPIEIFNINFDDIRIPSQYYVAMKKLMDEITRIKEEGIDLYEFITILFLPILGKTRSKVIFSPFSTIQEFFDKFENDSQLETYISEVLEISEYTDTVQDIITTLKENKDWIYEAASWFKFNKSYGDTFFITLTGSVINVKDDDGKLFSPRDKFAKYVSDKVGANIQVVGFSENKTNILIMDTDMRSNRKYQKAKSAGIPVMKSDEFLNKMKELFGVHDEVVEDDNEVNNTTMEENMDQNQSINIQGFEWDI